MSEQEKTEMVEKETPEQPKEELKKESIAEAEIIDDDFDKERAMETIKKLREFEKKSKVQEKELLALKEAEQKRKESEMSEIDKANLRAETAEKELKELKAQKVRREIAEKVGLPVEFADRLRGETPEELEEDAKAFSEKMPKVPKISTTNPDGSNTTGKKTEMELLQEIKSGGAPGIFSLGGNQAQGGGVYYSPGKSGGVVESG